MVSLFSPRAGSVFGFRLTAPFPLLRHRQPLMEKISKPRLLIDRPFKHDIFRISYVVMAVSHIKSLVCNFENILL